MNPKENACHPLPEPRLFCFILDGEKFSTEDRSVTPQEIREIVGNIPSDVPIVQVLEDGTQQQLQEGEKVRLERCVKFKRLPRFIRGRGRVEEDLDRLRKEYPGAQMGPRAEYFVVPGYPLPPGVFREETTDLLVVVPPTYPSAPPDNFHVRWGLSLASGGSIRNYSGPVDLYGGRWGTFSFHIQPGAWRPGQNGRGDNLVTFLTAVRARLAEGA